MPQNDFSIQLEDLLLTLDNYTKKIDQQLLDTSNLNRAHYKQAQDIADWARALTSLLKTYQNKETLLQSDFIAAIDKEMVSVFQANEENYHKRIDEGFTKHITEASDEFLKKTEKLNKDLEKLQTSVTSVSSNLDDTKDKIAEQNVEASRQMLDDVKQEFNRRLTTTSAFLVFVVFVLSVGAMWMFIPSKSEISERQDSYNSLAKARVAHNVIKKSDGYYARVEPKGCITDESSSFYSESVLCKFK